MLAQCLQASRSLSSGQYFNNATPESHQHQSERTELPAALALERLLLRQSTVHSPLTATQHKLMHEEDSLSLNAMVKASMGLF